MVLHAESLDLRGVWLRDSSRESFVSGIRKLRRLRKLSIPYVANDELLGALAKNCPDLRHLDLAGASEVTAAGAEQLYRAPSTQMPESLVYLNLGGPSGRPLPTSSVADLISNLV